MLFYNARPCCPGGLVDSVTDSGGGGQGSYPIIDTSPTYASSKQVLFYYRWFSDELQYVIIDISNRLFMVDPNFFLYGFRC